MTAPIRTLAGAAVLALAVGCQQRMAEQPYERPYEENAMFPHNQSMRPLEKGTVHRNQPADDDPIATWLTPQGKAARPADVPPSGNASYDPKSVVALPGAPNSVDNFVKDLPFEITEGDLKRGQVLYNANCALCHGAAGYGNGKIPERGFLRPPSYHVDPAGKDMDWSTLSPETGLPLYSTGLKAGYSRGFFRWGVNVPLKEVPVGYIYQVITWGYGGMASHDVQLAAPADRWRVVAYVRTLQISQAVPEADLPAEAKAELNGGTK
jgi:hypothetical protein